MKDSLIMVLGFVQALPCVLLVGGTLAANLAGLAWLLLLLYMWGSTRIGRAYFRALWRATLRLERAVFGTNAEC